eukprot:scaffold36073_cov17-Tisochrysis_lutea.AAC.2
MSPSALEGHTWNLSWPKFSMLASFCKLNLDQSSCLSWEECSSPGRELHGPWWWGSEGSAHKHPSKKETTQTHRKHLPKALYPGG